MYPRVNALEYPLLLNLSSLRFSQDEAVFYAKLVDTKKLIMQNLEASSCTAPLYYFPDMIQSYINGLHCSSLLIMIMMKLMNNCA
ncbi:hypothetical protein Lal_00035075 [Lupinus albus]|nr:hypothetical protein Lal_00035075 [Lupinus albus]